MRPDDGCRARHRLLAGLGLALATWAAAAPPAPPASTSTPGLAQPAAKPAREDGPRWSELSPAHRAALKPLERDWATLDAPRKQKWVDIATRMPRMSADEQQRVQTRMSQWAAMTPVQRTQARLQFKEAEQVAPTDRRARWEAYQALSAEQKRQLAGQRARASETRPTAPRAETAAAAVLPQQKSNIVPNPSAAARPKAVAPAVVQAAPGATTSLVSKPASPPAHQQAGLPKIAGSSNFIDPATLLPRRGPQGAAVTAAVASAPLPRP